MAEAADWICTDDIVHSTADSMVALDMLGGVRPAVNSSMLTMHSAVSRESHCQCAPVEDAGKVHRTLQIVSHSNSCRDQPNCICFRNGNKFSLLILSHRIDHQGKLTRKAFVRQLQFAPIERDKPSRPDSLLSSSPSNDHMYSLEDMPTPTTRFSLSNAIPSSIRCSKDHDKCQQQRLPSSYHSLPPSFVQSSSRD